MNKTTETNFVKMCLQGIVASLIGIVSGAFLGLVIYFLQYLLGWISTIGQTTYPMNYGIAGGAALVQLGIMGACFGAIIGAIFGCILSLKELPKK